MKFVLCWPATPGKWNSGKGENRIKIVNEKKFKYKREKKNPP